MSGGGLGRPPAPASPPPAPHHPPRYALVGQGKALITPGVAELTAAGMPEGVSALGQELPLFACMGMARPGACKGLFKVSLQGFSYN